MGKCCHYIIFCTIDTLPVDLNMIVEIFVDVIPTVYSGPCGLDLVCSPLLDCEGGLVQYFAEPGSDPVLQVLTWTLDSVLTDGQWPFKSQQWRMLFKSCMACLITSTYWAPWCQWLVKSSLCSPVSFALGKVRCKLEHWWHCYLPYAPGGLLLCTHISYNRVFQTCPTQGQLVPQLNPKFKPQLESWELLN